jgi:hypothetical protein
VNLSNYFSDFLNKKGTSPNADNFFYKFASIFLGMGMPHGCAGMFPRKEGGIQVLAVLTPLSQIVRSLLRMLWLAEN